MRRKVNLSASKQYIAIDDVARLAGMPLSALQDKISDESHSQKILLDEADVAYCAEVYRAYSSKGRRWLFNDDGTPYLPKSEPSLDVTSD